MIFLSTYKTCLISSFAKRFLEIKDALINNYMEIILLIVLLHSSVSDPSHFDVDPDPGIHIWEKWIQILGSTFP